VIALQWPAESCPRMMKRAPATGNTPAEPSATGGVRTVESEGGRPRGAAHYVRAAGLSAVTFGAGVVEGGLGGGEAGDGDAER
jgi:hypothetical protein